MPTMYATIEDIHAHLTYSSSPALTSFPPRQTWTLNANEGTLIQLDTEQVSLTILSPVYSSDGKRLGWRARTWFAEARRERNPGEIELVLNVTYAALPPDEEYVIPFRPHVTPRDDTTDNAARKEASLLRRTVRERTMGGKHYRDTVRTLLKELPGLTFSSFSPGIREREPYDGVRLKGTYSTYPFEWKQGGPAHIIRLGHWEGRYPMHEMFGVVDDEPSSSTLLYCTPRIYPASHLTKRILENLHSLKEDNPDIVLIFPEPISSSLNETSS